MRHSDTTKYSRRAEDISSSFPSKEGHNVTHVDLHAGLWKLHGYLRRFPIAPNRIDKVRESLNIISIYKGNK